MVTVAPLEYVFIAIVVEIATAITMICLYTYRELVVQRIYEGF